MKGKGKITHVLASKKTHTRKNYYNFVCRFQGGSNAGHTIYHNGKKFATHIVPSGVFYGITSVIGPNCVVNLDAFYKELEQLKLGGIDISLVKVHPNANIVTNEHIAEDKATLGHLGTTSQGIAPAYRDKAARKGLLAKHSPIDKSYILTEKLHGNILCEGAQGYHLDINYGNYPFVTSSECLPYGACSLGFAPQKIKSIYACAKIYDTRSGEDPLFPSTLLEDQTLKFIGDLGQEYGVTTGRRRKVNWLNLDKLIEAVEVGGATDLIVNKCDILQKVGVYRLFHNSTLLEFESLEQMKEYIQISLFKSSTLLKRVLFSGNPEILEGFNP
jgi:adenylosuccinate synthase